MDSDQFTRVYYPKYQDVIERIATRHAFGDMELRDDLIQEGLLTLWKLDPSKARINEDAWIRQAIAKRMKTYLRRVKPSTYVSLDQALEQGWQIEELPSGEKYLKRGTWVWDAYWMRPPRPEADE